MTSPPIVPTVEVPITVPEAAIPRIAALIRARYPDLDGDDDLDVGRRGVARMIRELLRTAEANRIEQGLQDKVAADRIAQLSAVDALLSQIV